MKYKNWVSRVERGRCVVEKIILSITDLTCARGGHRIEQVMRQQEGVVWATVNFAAGEATILFDPAVFRKNRFFRAVYQLGFHLDYKDEDINPALQIRKVIQSKQSYLALDPIALKLCFYEPTYSLWKDIFTCITKPVRLFQ